MTSLGRKIIDGLEDAARGNFRRVTIQGETWVKLSNVNTMEDYIREIVRDEMIRCRVLIDKSDDI